MSEYVTIPLDIEGVKVNRVEVTSNGEVHIHVSSTVDGTRCHRCGRDIHHRYDEGRKSSSGICRYWTCPPIYLPSRAVTSATTVRATPPRRSTCRGTSRAKP